MRVSVVITLLTLTACASDYVPREKVATYDRETQTIEFAYPCPDWSHASDINYDNSVHSNYGCATRNNLAQQLAYPQDLDRASGADGRTDTEGTVRTIQRYRAGEIPVALQPMQGASSGGE